MKTNRSLDHLMKFLKYIVNLKILVLLIKNQQTTKLATIIMNLLYKIWKVTKSAHFIIINLALIKLNLIKM